MSRSERAKMLDRVAKRAQRIKDLRVKTSKSVTYTHHVFNFLKEMEKIYPLAKDAVDFDAMLGGACKMLDQQIKTIDPYVKIEILWNDAEDWTNLRATGVKIMWSGSHMNRYPGKQAEEYIDITQALLEDLGVLYEESEKTKT